MIVGAAKANCHDTDKQLSRSGLVDDDVLDRQWQPDVAKNGGAAIHVQQAEGLGTLTIGERKGACNDPGTMFPVHSQKAAWTANAAAAAADKAGEGRDLDHHASAIASTGTGLAGARQDG